MKAAEATQYYKDKALVADRFLEQRNYESYQKNGQRYSRNRSVKSTLDQRGAPTSANGIKYREVFIGKLPRDLFEDELVPMLEFVGTVELIRLMMDFSGTNRGYAFALYSTKEEAIKAVKLLNDVSIRTDEQPIGVVLSFDNRALTLGNLPRELDKNRLRQELDRIISGIESIEFTECSPNAIDRFACITFVTHDMATQARRVLCPGDIKICERKLTVDWAKPDKPRLDDNDARAPTTLKAPFPPSLPQRGQAVSAHQSRGPIARRAPIMATRPRNNQLHQQQLPHRNMSNTARYNWPRAPLANNHHVNGARRSPPSSASSSSSSTTRRTPSNRVVGPSRPPAVPLSRDINNNHVQLMDSILESLTAPFVPVLAPSPSPCILGEKAREMLAACPPDPLCTTIIENIDLSLLDQTRLFTLFQLDNHFKVTRILPLPPSTLEVTYAQPHEAKFVTDLLNLFPGQFKRLAVPGSQIVARQVRLPPQTNSLYASNHLPSLYNIQGILSH